MKPSPNYLVILIHGIGNNSKSTFGWKDEQGNYHDGKFGNLFKYLEVDLGLEGYIYAFDLENAYGSSVIAAQQIGGNNGWSVEKDENNNIIKRYNTCWFETARNKYKKWYFNKYKSIYGITSEADVPIPQKYVLICHSMGGLAARYYITSDFYNNDVIKLVTLDTPHLGADGITWYRMFNSLEGSIKNMYTPYADYALRSLFKSYIPFPEDLYVTAGHWTSNGLSNAGLVGLRNLISNVKLQGFRGFEPGPGAHYNFVEKAGGGLAFLAFMTTSFDKGTGFDEMDPDSEFVRTLKTRKTKQNVDPIHFRLVSARGTPTPHKDLIKRYFNFTPYTIGLMLPFLPEYNALPSEAQKAYAAVIAVSIPGSMPLKDGSLLVALDSSRGEGVEIFETHTEKYEYYFAYDELEKGMNIVRAERDAILLGCLLTGQITNFPLISKLMFVPTIHLSIMETATLGMGSLKNFYNHGYIVEKSMVGSPSIIEQALDDTPLFGGTSDSGVEKSGISAASIASTTASYNDYEQAFVLLSDLDGDGKPIGSFHTVTIEAFTETNADSGISFPVEINGQKKWVSAVTVKEPPTAVKGVINTFLPKKMKQFQYSENFAAWKDVGEVDRWGNFTLAGLKLAEGQNVVAFLAESWTGNRSNQHLKIIVNTIPMLPSELQPLPGTFTNNNRPTFSGKFAKAAYSEDKLENISLSLAKLVSGDQEVDVTDQVKTEIGGGDYNKELLFEWSPGEPLSDGQHSLVVTVNSNVGVSQAVMNVTVDTQAPTIALQTLKPYSARAPTTIKYTASDEASPNLHDVRCELFNLNDDLITTIATADSLSKGENFFTWSGSALLGEGPGVRVADGQYKIRIKAYDLAGNYAVAEQPITIDSTPPSVMSANIEPQPVTTDSSTLRMTARVSERSTVIISLKNLSKNTASAYLTQATPAEDGNASLANYTWTYDNMFAQGPEDGIYRAEIIARDEAGNESLPKTLEAVRIDRTAPVIFGQMASPYVLANSGANAYKTTLSFDINESNDVKDNQKGNIEVTVKLYNANSGKMLDKWVLSSERSVPFNASDPKYAKGAYRFQIIAKDDVGNTGVAYASCVKDGIAPAISYPAEDGVEVAGTISIRGTAIDPDWTNDLPFKQYRVFCKKGVQAPALAGEGWGVEAVEVPLINRGDSSTPRNVSLRPLQNDSTLAYLHTNLLENGEYTVLVVVDENGGETLAAARVIKVNNDEMTAASLQLPYIKLRSLPSEVEFKADNSVKLPIGFVNSVKPANVYVEVLKPGTGEATPVFFKYFPNIIGAPFIGRPDYQAGADLGYFIWGDEDGYHLRWSANGSSHKFTGSIVLVGSGSYSDVKQTGGGIRVQSPLISWDTALSGGEGGVDFKLDSGQLMITAKIDEDPNSPSIYAQNVYLGVSKYTQDYLPIMIDVSGQRLVNLVNMGGQVSEAKPANLARATQTIEWDGKLDTGAFVDNGAYIIRVRAEGADGIGVASDEALVSIGTPYELKVASIAPADREFSTISVPDRLSVYYTVSKDSIITASVYTANGTFVSKLLEAEAVLGVQPDNPHSVSWLGNYPEPSSGLLVPPGEYKIVFRAEAKDGQASKEEVISGINVSPFTTDSNVVRIDPIGEETDFDNGNGSERIRLAEGDSPFFFEAKGIGKYHPPKDFSYTLAATGKQKITAYPYVPFAGLMHRGFRQVDTKVKVKFKIHAWNWEQGVHKDIVLFGHKVGSWYDPLAWGIRFKEFEKERWIEIDDLRNGNKGVVFRDGNEDGKFSFEFDSNDWWHQNEWDNSWGKAKKGSGIDSIDVQVEVYARDGSFLLDLTPPSAWILPSSAEVTEKGIFEVASSGQEFMKQHDTLVTGGNWVEKSYGCYRIDLDLNLEARIAYSRLTNRFVPWVGFVNAKTPENVRAKDFAVYLTDINKGLGFPGKLFFEDPDAEPGEPYEPIAGFEGKSWNDLVAELNSQAQTANLKGYKDSLASSVGYDSYLSGEYFEFIPITLPGGKEYGGFQYSDGSTVVKAYTNLVYSSAGNDGRISPFDFSWPLVDSELGKFNDDQQNIREKLDPSASKGERNPQNYTGTSPGGTWWELDPDEIKQRRADRNNSVVGAGQVRFNKLAGKSEWGPSLVFGEVLPIPGYVEQAEYSVVSNTPNIRVYPEKGGSNTSFKAEDLEDGKLWTTSDDLTLLESGGLVKSGPVTFNEHEFLGRRELKISEFYEIDKEYKTAPALKYAFLKNDPFERFADSPIDNPNVVISDWQIKIRDKTGRENNDLVLEKVDVAGDAGNQAHFNNDKFKLKLKLKASEARYVEVNGEAPGAYELMFFDGKDWKTIYESYDAVPTRGRLAWWDVSRLNGKYTLLLKSGALVAAANVYIGTLIDKDQADSAWSAYKRAQLEFPAGAFVNGSAQARDQLVTVTPVSMTEIKIRNRPILLTHGPIVEIKPSPWEFEINPEDKRPTLRFVYTFDDLAELGVDTSKVAKDAGEVKNELMLPWNIHQVTEAGDLQIVANNKQEVEVNNGEWQYAFYAPLDHFSTYTLLQGKFSLSAPIVHASRYITNQDTVAVFGTAEPGSILTIYVKTENAPPDPEKAEPYFDRVSAEAQTGDFRFEGVKLLQEGDNYIFVTSHLEADKNIRTYSDAKVVKDTVPPSLESAANLYAFSPNSDGKYDSVDYTVKADEPSKIYLSVASFGSQVSGQLINEEISAEPNKEYKINWAESSVRIYKPGTTSNWAQIEERALPSTYPDGEYISTVYAIDEAGNISANIINKTIVDTTPPRALGLFADPSPFTPDDDGVKDSATFSYQFSEPVYATLSIYRDDGALFRKREGPTAGFSYPTTNPTGDRGPATGDWVWDGRGSRNELLGGEYTWAIQAEDWVGNSVSSGTNTILVDRTPTLVPYAYAEPDPFSPVNPNNSFTEIVYYLGRDNLNVSVAVKGAENSVIKTLVNNETQGKGEHRVRWYGDFASGYDGSTAVKNQYRVGDGSYEFRILARDPDGGQPADVTNTVLADNTPPNLVIRPVQVDYGSGVAILGYNIPEQSSVEVEVYDEDNAFVEALVMAETQLSGDHVLDYDFRHLPDTSKKKYFKIIAQDRAQNISEKTTELFSVNPLGGLEITNLSAAPNPFTPNGDGLTDLTRISYRVSGGKPDYRTNISIISPSGATVKTLVENEPQVSGTYSFYWDGRGDGGQLAGDGDYEYVVTVVDMTGKMIEGRGPMLVVSTRPIVDVSTDLSVFSPNGDGHKDTISFNYSIDYPVAYIAGEALVELDVLDVTGKAVWNKIFNHTPGTYNYVWDGSKSNGEGTVESGVYYVRIKAEDMLHSTAFPKTVSFEVDVTSPEVEIAPPGSTESIVNPEKFSTNANPDETDLPRSTTFYYTLAEKTKVMVEVHRVDDGQIAYAKDDFNAGTLVATLISEEWQDGDIQQLVSWDGAIQSNQTQYDTDNDGYADPGKYAFIVYGVDEQENPTLMKWGGTVWIQNNLLTLQAPEQLLAELGADHNPDPQVISPNSNSAEPTQKRAKFYFYVDLSLIPETTTAPERIEAAAVITDTKKVGKYSVKVYSDSGLTNLVRTITSEADAQAATLTWEDWKGKDDSGQFVADGTYYMVVDVEDYAGNPAIDNLLTGQVTVDNSVPVVSDLAAAPYYFSPGSSVSTADSTTLTYKVLDNSDKAFVTIKVYRDENGDGQLDDGDKYVETLVDQEEKVADGSAYGVTWTPVTVGTLYNGGFADGKYFLVVSAMDEGGSSAEVMVKDVVVDTMDPTFGAGPELQDWATGEIKVVAGVSGGDSGINSAQYAWSDVVATPAAGWGDFADGQTVTYDQDGEWYLHLKAEDNAGNSASAYYGLYKNDDVDPVVGANPTVRGWAVSEISVALSASDAHSGVDYAQYAWSADTSTPDTGWNNYYNTNVISLASEGSWYLHLMAKDNVGNTTSACHGPYQKDNTAPSLGANPGSRGWESGTISATLNVSDALSGVKSSEFVWSTSSTPPGSGWAAFANGQTKTQSTDGIWYLHLRASDNVNNSSSATYGPYRKDSVAPSVSAPTLSLSPFNQMYETTQMSWSMSDTYSGSEIYYEAGIYTPTNTLVRIARVYGNGAVAAGGRSYTWDGKNDADDFVNEGNYKFRVRARDRVGNESGWKELTIVAQDDIRISNTQTDSNNPHLSWSAQPTSTLILKWVEGSPDDSLQLDESANVDQVYHGNSAYGDHYADKSANFTIEFSQVLEVGAAAWGEHNSGGSEYHAIKRASNDTVVWEQGGTGSNDGSNHFFTDPIDPGTYYAWVDLKDAIGWDTYGHTRVWYYDRRYAQHSISGSNYGSAWGSATSPVTVTSISTGPRYIYDPGPTMVIEGTPPLIYPVFVYSAGTDVYEVYGSGGDLFYRKGSVLQEHRSMWVPIPPGGIPANKISWSSSAQITRSGAASSFSASLNRDASDNMYVAWQDSREGNNEIYFQKIPKEFAAVNGTVTMSILPAVQQPTVAASGTFEAPILVAPDDDSNVTSLRPTFKWQHEKLDTQEYRIDLAEDDAFSINAQSFTKSPNTGSPDETDPALFHYTYAIHEFDPGLDRTTYYWRVTADTTSESATSEVRSFTVAPQLTLTGVTNYPNPFNPNSETTKIRYRLGADADSVKIRIYDVTGSLVIELDGGTAGESSSIWDKYNDVAWDGRNGRGDLVVNGIYPFEVIARLGDRSVSGRGKIAVLK
ncbi:hypothetical protein ACFL4J_00185 [Candidatus Margulisiibacteriota bacterium]